MKEASSSLVVSWVVDNPLIELLRAGVRVGSSTNSRLLNAVILSAHLCIELAIRGWSDKDVRQHVL